MIKPDIEPIKESLQHKALWNRGEISRTGPIASPVKRTGSDKIEKDINLFLARGGEITQIDDGVSGYHHQSLRNKATGKNRAFIINVEKNAKRLGK